MLCFKLYFVFPENYFTTLLIMASIIIHMWRERIFISQIPSHQKKTLISVSITYKHMHAFINIIFTYNKAAYETKVNVIFLSERMMKRKKKLMCLYVAVCNEMAVLSFSLFIYSKHAIMPKIDYLIFINIYHKMKIFTHT